MALIKLVEKEQADPVAQNIYRLFEENAGNVPEWVKVMAHCPNILKEFTELFNVIMMQTGKLEATLKWKVGYVVSETLRCRFCVDVTTKMLKKFGANEKVLGEIKNLQADDETEKRILALAKDITLDGHLDNPKIFDELKEILNEIQLVELISVIGLFNYINRFNITFGVLPE